MQKRLFAAIDLGGTKIYTVIADYNCKIIARSKVTTAAGLSAEIVIGQMLTSLLEALKRAEGKPEELTAIGVCVAGFYDWQRRVLIDSPNLPHLNNVNLEEILQNELGIPALVENDANAAAIGEARYGAALGSRNMVFVTVSTGIGAGLVLDGHLYRGSNGFSGEIGHMAVKPGGPVCGCGKCGCLESVASGTAIARNALEALQKSNQTLLKSYYDANQGVLTAADVFAAAQAGDDTAQGILAEALYQLGIGMVNVINLLNPSVLVIGGGVAEAGEAFFKPLRQIISEYAVSHIARNVSVRQAQLGAEAGVTGMLSLLQESFLL